MMGCPEGTMLMDVTDEVVERPDDDVPDEETAASPPNSVDELLTPERIDQLLADAEAEGLAVDGPGGLLSQLTKAVLERALDAELTDHLGYDRGDVSGYGAGNHRNGTYPKTVLTTTGPVELAVPRDRTGTFSRRSCPSAGGGCRTSTSSSCRCPRGACRPREIKAHLAEVYGLDVSHEWVAKVTDVVTDEIRAWQNRPLDEVYPILYIDALRIKVRDGGSVVTKAAYLAVGIDLDGRKHVLGLWLAANEGAKFWLQIATELRHRGVRDVIIVCCDGLTGLPDAITNVWPDATVQTCVVHLIRGTLRYTSWNDRKAVTAALKPIYTAPSIDAAEQAFAEFKAKWGMRIPAR